jgi:hypothetical protein
MKNNVKIKPSKKMLFLSLTLTLLTIFFIILELSLRTFLPQPPRGFSNNLFTDENGLHTLKPSITGTQYSREFDIKITGNKYGYRGDDWDTSTERKKCIIIGDSFAFGWGVKDKDIFTHYLDSSKYEYINLGIPGDGPQNQLQRLTWAFSKFNSIDLVILLMYDNDISDFKLKSTSSNSISNNIPLTTKIKNILLHLHTVRLIAQLVDKLGLSDLAADASGWQTLIKTVIKKDLPIHKKGFFDTAKWDECRYSYYKIIQLCRNNNAELSTVRIVPQYFLTPSIQDENIKLCKLNKGDYNFDKINQTLNLVFKNYWCYRPQTSNLYFKFDKHLNSSGHNALGRFIDINIIQKRHLGLKKGNSK